MARLTGVLGILAKLGFRAMIGGKLANLMSPSIY
jgi:nucleoside permease NupC